ncbi:3',5'-cyclic adenosine monophosphate phosphodiesterase CpdA [Agrobacterium fabrum]|uniref:metallophosphoesterase n=1 Tax=Agrobacterium fabrum TaxID=1176649 RepID=UPI001D7F4B27|nr:metallophosphoesterase [Agrobacterium fabrum]CAH0247687.1 3',5'-cyclic adenosine monophosphate phosphodiesterase CpdA [Agrobacterium fabrum]CAH0247787.1 3',5'-cyclic adenosine monophosphate phosphodiesterase CpdA [Agrobacterium fabrum]
MKLWIVSDIHLEFGEPFLQTPPDGVDVMICAGDVAIKGIVPGLRWLAKSFARHIPVVVVAGNHDFYSASIEEGIRDAREYASGLPNVYFLENDACEIGGVRFVGGTLWTDFRLYGRNPTVAMSYALHGMNDFKKIKLSKRPFRKFRPLDAYQKHIETRNFIDAELREHAVIKTTVVVTHHAPSPRSIDLGFRHDPLSACYASDMEDLLCEVGPRLWIHGHLHHRNDYVVADTRVVSNAMGYPNEETGFDPNLVVEVTPNPGPKGEIVDAMLSIPDRAPNANPDPGDEL